MEISKSNIFIFSFFIKYNRRSVGPENDSMQTSSALGGIKDHLARLQNDYAPVENSD